jgi:hypothetical protein
MSALTELRERAQRAWWRSLRARVLGEPFFPWEMPLPRISSKRDDFDQVRRRSEELMAHAKEKTGQGYTLICESRNTPEWGRNSLPVRVAFESAADLDTFLGTASDSAAFERDFAVVLQRYPSLRDWSADHAETIVKYAGKWPDLLTVCDYFVSTPQPGLFLRELPLPLHTKFIEDHRAILRQVLDQILPNSDLKVGGFEERFGLRVPEALVRVRFLDPALRERLGFPFDFAGIARSDFANLPIAGENLLITENEITFLTLPPLPNTLGIWGSGFAVASLGVLPILHDVRIFYWGDLDVQGFEILAALRDRAPKTQAVLMDRATWEEFRGYAVNGKPSRGRVLESLSESESVLFSELEHGNHRLEQERINHQWACERIREALASAA